MMGSTERIDQARQWIATWTSTTQPIWRDQLAFPTNLPPRFDSQTVCQHLRLGLGGTGIRFVFSNEYGTRPLDLGPVGIRLTGDGHCVYRLTFGGRTEARIPPEATLTSDALAVEVPALSELSVRSFLPKDTLMETFHWDARQTSRLLPGDQALTDASDGVGEEFTARVLLSAVEVASDPSTRAISVIGDSLVDGNGVAINSYTRWTDHLAELLVPHKIAVLNAGQSGSCLLRDGIGIATLTRFERDVLDVPGVSLGIVQVGLNDLGWPGTVMQPHGEVPSAHVLIDGYRDLLRRAARRGVRLMGATLSPFRGAFADTAFEQFHSDAKDLVRQQVNAWMRDSGEFAAVIDVDAVLRDPSDPMRIRADLDVGDRLHPGAEGNIAIAHAVPVNVLLELIRR